MPRSPRRVQPTGCPSSPHHRAPGADRAAKLLVYVKSKLGHDIPERLRLVSKDIYGRGGDDYIVELCQALREIPEKERERIIYNAHDRNSRDLADWWEDHLAADAKRTTTE